jgi:putative transposase
MSRRWLSAWKDSREKAVIYHCISRVVDRRFVLEEREREHFRMLMRMMENFSGCRVLSYCLMSNHFHLLLEVPPMAVEGISDAELLKRLGGLYSKAFVAEVAKELLAARTGCYAVSAGVAFGDGESVGLAAGTMEAAVAAIHARFTYRMHDLSEFMKTLLQRFTRWFNRTHERSGTLWEERYKSVIVESGTAARMVAAYIDLNPVRAGIVADPAVYRWSSYGEAIGGGKMGNGKKARAGLVRAYYADQEVGMDADLWPEVARLYRRMMGMALGRNPGQGEVQLGVGAGGSRPVTLNAAELLECLASEGDETVLNDLGLAEMLACRVRYFTDGAVIGSKGFVNDAFTAARERFTAKRKDGARRLKGIGKPAAGLLWSARDLRVDR